MPIFPEHLHLDGEDGQLRHIARDRRYRLIFEGYVAVLVIGALIFVVLGIALGV